MGLLDQRKPQSRGEFFTITSLPLCNPCKGGFQEPAGVSLATVSSDHLQYLLHYFLGGHAGFIVGHVSDLIRLGVVIE